MTIEGQVMVESGCQIGEHSPDFPSGLDAEYQGSIGSQTKAGSFIPLAVQIAALFLSPLPRPVLTFRDFSNFKNRGICQLRQFKPHGIFLSLGQPFATFP